MIMIWGSANLSQPGHCEMSGFWCFSFFMWKKNPDLAQCLHQRGTQKIEPILASGLTSSLATLRVRLWRRDFLRGIWAVWSVGVFFVFFLRLISCSTRREQKKSIPAKNPWSKSNKKQILNCFPSASYLSRSGRPKKSVQLALFWRPWKLKKKQLSLLIIDTGESNFHDISVVEIFASFWTSKVIPTFCLQLLFFALCRFPKRATKWIAKKTTRKKWSLLTDSWCVF